MKRGAIIFFILSIFCNVLHAQDRFKAGVKAGLSTSQVHGDGYRGFHKFGLDAGIFVTGKLNKNWTAQMEMHFIQKGSKHNGNPDLGDYSFYYLGLNYIEVPVMLQYHFKRFTFEAGAGYGYLIKWEEYDAYGKIVDPKPLKTQEIIVGGGMNVELSKHLYGNWRFTNSVLPIRSFVVNRKFETNGMRNNVLSFTLIYMFGKNGDK